jgi:DNA-binding response OmpR family regulator
MKKGRILVVEDDSDIGNMLRIYFTGQGYDVDLATTGSDALSSTHSNMPDLIVLDILLPDMDGYSVCQELRGSSRTHHIPIIFLTQKDTRSDRIAGLELGADDYITKPFDIEELKLRVQNAITRADRERLIDPRTGLPTGAIIQEKLHDLVDQKEWSLLDCRLENFEGFKEVYSFVTGDELLRMTAAMFGEILAEYGDEKDFLGHAGGGDFIVITVPAAADSISEQLKKVFTERIREHYAKEDLDRGHLVVPQGSGDGVQIPLMNMSIGRIDSTKKEFKDPHEITEAAMEARRMDAATS